MPRAPTPSTPVRTVLLARRVPVWSKGGTAPGASEVFSASGHRRRHDPTGGGSGDNTTILPEVPER